GLARVGDLDPAAGQLERVVYEACSVHRLDRGPNRQVEAVEAESKTAQAVGIRRCRAHLHARSGPVEQMEVETLAAEIQSDVQHAGASLRLFEDARSMTPREALLHHIPCGRLRRTCVSGAAHRNRCSKVSFRCEPPAGRSPAPAAGCWCSPRATPWR